MHEETGLDAIHIYTKLPLVCVYAFEHVWYTKQGIDCKWYGTQSTDEVVADLFSS